MSAAAPMPAAAGSLGLDGVRVVDLTHVIAGPFATHQLAMLGADVIKVENPRDPDVARSMGAGAADGMGALFRAQGAGKRAVALNFADPEDRAAFDRLLADADVLVENYRAGALGQFGLDYETLSDRFPRLVYASITGFGRTGPRAAQTAYDNVVQAASGLMSLNGAGDLWPLKIGAPVVDYATGLTAALGVMAALYQRERTGHGDHVDIAMSETALTLAAAAVLRVTESGAKIASPQPDAVGHPGLAAYATRDGQLMLGAMTRRQWSRLAERLGVAEWPALYDALGDPRVAARVQSALAEIFAKETAAHWERVLNAAGVPAQRIRPLHEALADPQLAARDALAPVDDGPGRIPRPGFRLRSAPPRALRPAPRIGADNHAVLSEVLGERARDDGPNRSIQQRRGL